MEINERLLRSASFCQIRGYMFPLSRGNKVQLIGFQGWAEDSHAFLFSLILINWHK